VNNHLLIVSNVLTIISDREPVTNLNDRIFSQILSLDLRFVLFFGWKYPAKPFLLRGFWCCPVPSGFVLQPIYHGMAWIVVSKWDVLWSN